MEKSPLRFIKDFDIILTLNELVPKSRENFTREFYTTLYKDKLNNNINFFSKIHIDDTFWKINQKYLLNKSSFMRPIFPFYNCSITKVVDVKHAISVYEEYSEDKLPCGIESTGAQCMCDICLNIDDY